MPDKKACFPHNGTAGFLSFEPLALLVALIAAPGKSEGMFMAAFGATMVLIPFGIPLFLFGAMVGLLLNRLTKNRSPEKKLV